MRLSGHQQVSRSLTVKPDGKAVTSRRKPRCLLTDAALNKIEHRLFSFITANWRGRPLTNYRTIVNLIAGTSTKTGLVVKARLDRRTYKCGVKVSKKELEALNLKPHEFHGEWNYTITPQRCPG